MDCFFLRLRPSCTHALFHNNLDPQVVTRGKQEEKSEVLIDSLGPMGITLRKVTTNKLCKPCVCVCNVTNDHLSAFCAPSAAIGCLSSDSKSTSLALLCFQVGRRGDFDFDEGERDGYYDEGYVAVHSCLHIPSRPSLPWLILS